MYADDSRYVLHDEGLMSHSKGKLKRPTNGEGWQQICAGQEGRFVVHLQTAQQNQKAAERYLECLVAQQASLDQELAYRLAHGSYKALSWSRDLACKWLALLAHYVPDAELQFLPLAGTPGPKIDFVHHETSVEALYAATLVISATVNVTVADLIKDVVTAKFDGEDDRALLQTSLALYGAAKFLQQVGTAQVNLMRAWVDPSIVNRLKDATVPRGEHRDAGIYRDFYDLGFIVHSPEPLNAILKGFHAGTTYAYRERFLTSFVEFRRLYLEVTPSTKPSSGAES